jgi:hypothetical protein
MPETHIPLDASFDEQSAKALLAKAVRSDRQSHIIVEGQRRAKALIKENERAVVTLRDSLIDNRGFLDAADVTELLDRLLTERQTASK